MNLNGQIFFENFEVDVFAKNLFDQKYASGAVYTLATTTDIRYEVALGRAADLRHDLTLQILDMLL